MSTLFIDVGNTRVKWALLKNGRLSSQRAAAHAGWRARDFSRAVFSAVRGIESVVVVSVAGPRVNRALVAASRQRCKVTPLFVRTRRSVAGVTTRYEEPWRLGVDRFIAAIGAHHLAGNRAVCVVDVGTAMTIDLVDARGVHQGGAIIPGPDLMISSLLNDTSGIGRRAAGSRVGRALFARNTRAAIEQGARYAVAASIDRAIGEAQRIVGEKPVVILTGGAVSLARPLLHAKHRVIPDLVLRGLALVYHSASRSGEIPS